MKKLSHVVIRFTGDSGDGMQLVGTQFSNTSAIMGNDLATFPDFPAEIRAPAGTVPGVSGFQVHIGQSDVHTPGDAPDVLIAMNPAALKANIADLKSGGVLIINSDNFEKRNLEKAGYEQSPLDTHMLDAYQVIQAPITSQTLENLKDSPLDNKSKSRCKNLYALGMVYYMFSRELDTTISWLEQKFKKKPDVAHANVSTLKAGYHFADTIEASISQYCVPKAKIAPGKYRHINGNTATAWGFIQASYAANLDLFLGSYPITPASDILHELSKYKSYGVKTFQAEDEIAAVCSAIGASYAGALSITSSSGPGIALKGEAMGLATIYELPLVVIDIQRAGPSTGMPTKTEQSDLNMALFGRNGECPMIIVAASRPNDCFEMAFEAGRLALEHMTPVMFLSDGYIANGAEPWKLPDLTKYSKIKTRLISKDNKDSTYLAYQRDEKSLVRTWATPGMVGHEHRLGGLEKEDVTGNVSYNPENHEKMSFIRKEKVERVAQNIPLQEIEGATSGDLLLLSWGGTYGATHAAIQELQEEGHKVSLAHLKYIHPMPRNVEDLIKNFKKIVVAELNQGQLLRYINGKFQCGAEGITKIQGQPFKISELKAQILDHLPTENSQRLKGELAHERNASL